MKVFLFFVMLISSGSCGINKIVGKTDTHMNKTYLALGDSYTIGEAVPQKESFPYQLVSQLNINGLEIAEPKIIAVTGWTTADLISGVKASRLSKTYDFVTLLIGVNNQYRKYSAETYRKEFVDLLNIAINHSSKGQNSVFVISIPDWGHTPFGQQKNPDEIRAEIDKFNAINKEVALTAGVHYIDITPGSRLALTDQSLIALDGLHPSGKMYKEWVKQLLPQVKRELY